MRYSEQCEAQLTLLAEAVARQREAEATLAQQIAASREAGASWAEVADVLGTSRQAAHQKWSRGRCCDEGCGCPRHRPRGCGCGHG